MVGLGPESIGNSAGIELISMSFVAQLLRCEHFDGGQIGRLYPALRRVKNPPK